MNEVAVAETGIESAPIETQTDAPAEVSVETTEPNVEAGQVNEQPKQEDTFVPFPKKAQNAITRRDRQIGKQRAQLAQLQAELDRLNTTNKPKSKDTAPNENDYDTYGDFIQAKTLHAVKEEMAANDKARLEQQQSDAQLAQHTQHKTERLQAIGTKAQEHAKNYPDFAQVVDGNAAFLDTLAPEIQQAFLNPQIDAALAFYNLAKTGRLDDLGNMSRDEALIYLYQAQTITKPTTKAPAPLRKPAAGTGSSSLGDLANDPNAMRKWLP